MRFILPIFLLSSALTLGGCSGVPLRSLPKLMQLDKQLLEAKPAEFMVALQVDTKLVPPPNAAPVLSIQVVPNADANWAGIDKKFPLQVAVINASMLGLDAPPIGRRWLIYSLPASTHAELQALQKTIQQGKSDPQRKGGGSLRVGVEQDSLARALTDPTLLHTRWETWLQTQKTEGFFEIWSGTPEQLQAQAAKNR